MTSPQPISLRELRERASTRLEINQASGWVTFGPIFNPADVFALVAAVEAAQRVVAKSSFHWEAQETIALTDALARFKDYGASVPERTGCS